MTHPSFRIAVLPGDGIGIEVVAATLQVLEPLCTAHGIRLDYKQYEFGAGYYRRTGRGIDDAAMEEIGAAHAVLFGAMGLPEVLQPDGRQFNPLGDLRIAFDLFASLRPVRLYPGVPTRLRAEAIDLLVVRETTEGLFAGLNDVVEPSDESATDRMTITRKTCLKLFAVAFDQARQRKARGTRGHVTLLVKDNALRSNVLMAKVFAEVAKKHPDIGSAKLSIDIGSMYFVTDPERYDVVVTENMFADIISEVGAGIVGGLGVAPSAEVSETRALFQPSHGSAPDIAGKGVANPVATMLSAAMMLEWLGIKHKQPVCTRAGEHLQAAVTQVLLRGPRTPDLGGTASTQEVTQAVIAALPTIRAAVS